MKKLLVLTSTYFILSTAVFAGEQIPTICYGFYAGLGGSWNTIDETYQSTFFTSRNISAKDHYNASSNRLAPLIQLGYWQPLTEKYLWGAVAQWKYLGYQTANVNNSRGQYIQNASFSSINFFGPNVVRDFTSKTKIKNEALFLFYLGAQLQQSYAYLGIGPVLFTSANSIYLSTVHVPDGTGDNLISTSTSANKTVWGGALQVGYNYYLDCSWFLNVNYTYIKSATNQFKNSVNTARFNGANNAGPTALNLKRNIHWDAQEVMLSINKVF